LQRAPPRDYAGTTALDDNAIAITMMKTSRVVPALCLWLSVAGWGVADAPPEGFVALFNGNDLAGWVQMNGSKFTAEDGVIKHRKGMGWLRSIEQYDHFILRLEVRWLKDRQDSGLFLRAGVEGSNWPDRKYEVQCENSERIVHIFGATCRRDPAKARALLKPTGEWNTIEIHCQGARCEVKLNGELASSASDLAPGKGYLGLQGENGEIEFRKLFLKRLKPSAAPRQASDSLSL
jgi:hypothetical protein